jgi:hypothetical protein
MGGLCKIDTNCFFGTTKSGLCPGPSNILCCVPPKPTCEGIDDLAIKVEGIDTTINDIQETVNGIEETLEECCEDKSGKKKSSKGLFDRN